MALRDLVSDRSKLTEKAIEDIVRDYVRYDPGRYEIVLTPNGLALNNDAKVLVCLVSIAGWPYVVDDCHAVDTTPAALEQITGIPGGTLRPVLKKLKDAYLVVSSSDGYAVRVANLDAIGRVIAGDKAVARAAAHKLKRATSGDGNGIGSVPSADRHAERGRRKANVPIRASLDRLVDNGFFVEGRLLGEVVVRLHEMAILAKATSLSGPIAELVRSGRLARKKVTEGGKNVWRYKSAANA